MMTGLLSSLVMLLFSQSSIATWFPSQVGDTWIYQNEERDGSNGGGMAHPEIGRWRTEESIISVFTVPEGVLLLKRIRTLDPLPPMAARIPSNKDARESYVLIHDNCVYFDELYQPIAKNDQLLPQYRADLIAGRVWPDFCFPLKQGLVFGSSRPTASAYESAWTVLGTNIDPFGLRGAVTYKLSSHQGWGTMVYRWFVEGVGVLQQISEHHGTYDESRRQLLSAVIGGKSRDYALTPAHTVPLSDFDCDGVGWQHYVRNDGAGFSSPADCIAYLKAQH